MFFFSFTYAQETCGLSEVPDSVYAAYASSLASHRSLIKSQEDGVKSNQLFRIPLHLYIAQHPDGRLPFDSSRASIEALFITSLQFVNESMASHGVEFFIVESDVIPFTSVNFVRNTPRVIDDFIRIQHPNDYDTNSFRVYLTEVRSARGQYPYGVVIGGGNTSARWLMHEIGHFFGLLHPQQQAYRNGTVKLYPDNTPTSTFDFNGSEHLTYNPQYCGDGSDVGLCYGDFIASTPVDLLDEFCNDVDQTSFNYQRPCTVSIQNEDTTYNADFFNVMSYWNFSATRLLPEQKQRMYDVIAYDSLGSTPFGGDMSHLTDSNVPAVNFTPPNYAYLRQTGLIDLAHYYPDSTSELLPFLQGKVRTRYIGVDLVAPHGRPYLGDGIFKINRFIPLNQPNSSVRFRFDSLSHECEPLPIYESSNYLNVGDLISIRLHILGLQEITDPYQKIAADVNNSGTIRTSDIVMLTRNILIGEPLSVPAYRFVPRYALSEYFAFENDFNANPFSASWTYNGNTYGYLESGLNESYLGTTEEVGGLPNLQSFALSLTDTNALKPVAVSFNAVRSGDVNMDDALIGRDICGTTSKDDLLGNGAMLSRGQKNTVRITFNHDDNFMGTTVELSIPSGEAAFVSEIYGNDISGVGPLAATGVMADVKSNEPANVFSGTIMGGTKELKFLVLPPSDAQKSSYIEFSVEGLKSDKLVSEVFFFDCDRSRIYSKLDAKAGHKSFDEAKNNNISLSASVEDRSQVHDGLRLFPNPGVHQLFVDFNDSTVASDKSTSLTILNINGRVVQNHGIVETTNGVVEIPISELKSGVYFVSLVSGGSRVVRRFVKK